MAMRLDEKTIVRCEECEANKVAFKRCDACDQVFVVSALELKTFTVHPPPEPLRRMQSENPQEGLATITRPRQYAGGTLEFSGPTVLMRFVISGLD